jgi:mono/diheme cytochrome c family protein
MALSPKQSLLAIGGLILVMGGASLLLRQELETPSMLKPGDAQVVAQGLKVYEAQCASCHGVNLEGQANWQKRLPDGRLPAPPHDESGHTWHHPGEVLFNITKYGPQHYAGADYASDMPKYEGLLSDADIIAVLSYIKSTWPPRIKGTHNKIEEEAAAKAAQQRQGG